MEALVAFVIVFALLCASRLDILLKLAIISLVYEWRSRR